MTPRVTRWLRAGTDEAAQLTTEIAEALDCTATIAAVLSPRRYYIELDEAGINKLHALVMRKETTTQNT